MAKITYVEANGTAHTVDVKPGLSLMEGAVKNGVPGILADCGGACACATCRVYVVDESWRDKLGAQGDLERAMVEYQADRARNLRLSCQIKVTEAMDGLVLRMPEDQHWEG